jgi:alpha/beta superfamily hydrolase
MVPDPAETLTTQDGVVLEARVQLPLSPHGGVVVCHPHPLYGGDMENPVVVRIDEVCGALGLATLRFNFRGVGRSSGVHGVVVRGEPRSGSEPSGEMIEIGRGEPRSGGEPSGEMIEIGRGEPRSGSEPSGEMIEIGRGEPRPSGEPSPMIDGAAEQFDVEAGLARLSSVMGAGRPVAVAGYSFGATVVADLAPRHAELAGVALVAPPLARTEPGRFAPLDRFGPRLLLVAGANDEICPADALARLADTLPRATVHLIDGANHFFFGKLYPLGEAVAAWARRCLLAV